MTMNTPAVTHHTATSANSTKRMRASNDQATGANAMTDTASRYVLPLSEEEAAQEASLLKALANPTRLSILNLLKRYEGKVSVLEIVDKFALGQPTISHHLHILRHAGLIDCEKKGLWVYYYLRRDSLQRVQDVITSLAE